MTRLRSGFLQTMQARGFIHQGTDLEGLDALLADDAPVTAYIGFDCTADSLHVGSLLPIMTLRWLQQYGHRPMVLLGGGTTRIGDPSGKDEARQLLSDDQIAANMAGIRQIFDKYLVFGDGPTDAVMVNNADWLDGLAYLAFLRDYGRHFTINRMLTFDSVRLRIDREQPLTFLEFNYMILQAYDFAELARRHGVRLQMGGSDQWGNIVNGVELGRRLGTPALFGLTTPLLTTASGQKMGKTHAGAVWLNADRLAPYDYWQFWRNTEDADVGRFLRLFTDLPLDEIARLEALQGSEINEAKKALADATTTLCHGATAAAVAAETARRTFEEGAAGDALPTVAIDPAALAAGPLVTDLLVQAGLVSSKKEARRMIKQNAVRVAGDVVSDDTRALSDRDLSEGSVRLSVGRKLHALVRLRG